MTLDLFTTSLLTGLVAVVAAVLYLLETILRKDGVSGRFWSVAFLSGVLTVVCYLMWALDRDAYVAVAIGNAAFVASTAFVWIGARAFNGRSLGVALAVVAAAIGIEAVLVLVAGPDGGDWAGAVPLFLFIAVFAALGSIETRRGSMGRRWSSIGLTLVLAVEGVFFAVRAGVFVVAGPDSELFRTWFSTAPSSLVTITLIIVTVVVTSVLRASESNLRGQRNTYVLHVGLDGVMMPASFATSVSTMLRRASAAGESVCLIAVSVEDLGRLAVASGPGDAETVATAWRTGVRRYAPTASTVGEDGPSVLLTAFVTNSFSDVRRTATIIHRRVLDDFAGLGLSVVPVVGVGIALTDDFGYDFADLAGAARDAAARSLSSSDTSVILASA